MKKILLLIPQNVIPVTDGGKAAIFNLISSLAKNNKVKAFVFIGSAEYYNLKKYDEIDVEAFFLTVDKNDSLKKIVLNLFCRLPFKFKKYYSSKHQQTIDQTALTWKPDIIICNHAHLAEYCKFLKTRLTTTKFVLREYNIEYLLVQQFFKLTKNPLAKAVAYWQFKKTKTIEEQSWQYFDKVLFISDTDFQMVSKDVKINKGIVLYEGSEVYPNTSNSKKPYFLFTGKVDVLQNKKNLENFIYNLWIPWKQKYNTNDFELWITGNTINEFQKSINISDRELSKYNIIIKGFIDDLSTVINDAYFFISPTIIGAGIRIKVIEAICKGCVVFLTSIDLQMVSHFKHLVNVVHYESIEDFNLNFELLTSNNQLYKSIQNNALITAREFLSREVFTHQLNIILQDKSMNK